MSEQTTNYMSELDHWTEETIIAPLADAYTHGPEEAVILAKKLTMRSIREKVLESYHNGQNSRPKAFQRPYKRR